MPYPASFYAALHRGTPGDTAFYVAQADEAKAVLELGCGYGRILSALIAPGRQTVGLDLDAALLELAAVNVGDGARLVRGDMRRFRLGARFDRIFIPHSSIYCLPTDDDVRACFACAHQHLGPGGRLVFDAYAADAFHADEQDPIPHAPETFVTTVEVDGASYDVWESSVWRREEQRIDVTYRYVEQEAGSVVEGSISHRYLLAPQIRRLLKSAGFSRVRMRGGFGDEPLDDGSEVVVVTASV